MGSVHAPASLFAQFPEVDRWGWFDLDEAGRRILPAQVELLDRLAALPADAPADVLQAALDIARRAGAMLDDGALVSRLAALPAAHPFAAPLHAARARLLYNQGDDEGARRSADAAITAGAAGVDGDVARAVLDRRVAEALGLIGPVTVIGVLLPKSGPPALVRFAAEVEEGIRAATEAADWPGRISIVVHDDGGTAAGAAAGMRALQEAGAAVVVGPLDSPELTAAAAARTTPVAYDPIAAFFLREMAVGAAVKAAA